MNKWEKKNEAAGVDELRAEVNQLREAIGMINSTIGFLLEINHLNPIQLPCKKLHPDAQLPTRGTDGSAGLDLYAIEDVDLWPGDIRCIRPGIAMEIPEQYFGLLATRSSFGKNGVRIAAGVNIVDFDFRGEVKIFLRNDGENLWQVKKGDRVAQIVITPYLPLKPIWAESLSETQRGTGGFGSTGR